MKTLYEIYDSGNIINMIFYDNETTEKINEKVILNQNTEIVTHEDICRSISERRVEDGEIALFVLAPQADYYLPEECIAFRKDAVLFFVGDEYTTVKKKIKKFLAKPKKVDKTLKVIDFEIKGNQMILYLGKPECEDYWGDDWNDRPYDCNAGIVYDEYVVDSVVVNFMGEDHDLREVSSLYFNAPFAKEDFKKGEPFAFLNIIEDTYDSFRSLQDRIFNNNTVKKFYYNTPVSQFYKMKDVKITD